MRKARSSEIKKKLAFRPLSTAASILARQKRKTPVTPKSSKEMSQSAFQFQSDTIAADGCGDWQIMGDRIDETRNIAGIEYTTDPHIAQFWIVYDDRRR